MSQIDVLRPTSVRDTGSGTAVPSGTLAAVTSDNSDATYIDVNESTASSWNLRVESHTPDAGYQRHRIRGRVRARTDAGTLQEDIDLGRGEIDAIAWSSFTATSTFAEYTGDWFDYPGYGLDTVGALADLNIGGGWLQDPLDSATELRTSECYVDIDCRLRPDYAPEVRDEAGADQAGGTVTDTANPTLWFGVPAYDDLPALDWAVVVSADGGGTVFSTSGSGVPPVEVPITTGLDDGDYEAVFTVRSTIRGVDPFEHTQSLTFAMENVVPPPSPPLLAVEEVFGGYQLSWSNPGGQEWDDNYVIAEVWRDDCTGSQRIATVVDGLNGTYLDLAIPQLDPRPDCEPAAAECDITYRVRYWGYVSNTVEIPDTIPVDLILAWPSTIATIPDGWSRVTSLDGYHVRGSSGTGAPSATGGATSHDHTTPGHRHTISAHSHNLPGESTSGQDDSTTTRRFNGADQPTANQSHAHPLPDRTGTAVQYSSSITAPDTNTVANDPPTRDVIWINSDGTATTYPVGVLGWATENVSGWTADATSRGRFLRGAAAATNGGLLLGSETHTHTVDPHTHTGASHDHSIDDTGLSTPVATTEAETGGTSPRWLPRHTHPMNVTPLGSMPILAASGGTTGAATREPQHRRLRVLRNTGGGAQTRIIGLYTGAVADLDPVLTLCNGGGGTPDMRGLFCRDVGSGSVNTVVGQNFHNHNTPSHSHVATPHGHETNTGTSRSRSFERLTSGDQGSVPTTGHVHNTPDASLTSVPILGQNSGNVSVESHIPLYKEVHFVRVDGTTGGGPLPVPVLRTSDYASITAPAFTYGDGLDRLASLTDKLAVVTDRSSNFPRLVVDSVPLDGGLHTVATTPAGEDLSLVIATEGLPAIEALEALLAADRLYWSPVGGTPGWFAPAGWTVAAPAPDIKVVSITMVRQDWPAVPAPEEFL